jgi:hypothetical protein
MNEEVAREVRKKLEEERAGGLGDDTKNAGSTLD